jgi:hypothetical protein
MSQTAIVRHYLQTYFFINLLACLPSEFWKWVAGTYKLGSFNKAARLVRLPRLVRLLRLIRMLRLAKFRSFASKNVLWIWLQTNLPGMRLMDLGVEIFVVTHIMACGWYLIAVIEDDPQESWLGRRTVSSDGTNLLDVSGPEQWLHAYYFVCTVFTTVGFGDMSAFTPLEMMYAMVVMVVGTIFHSIIVGEIIGALTNLNAREKTLATHKEIVERYSEHAEISSRTKRMLDEWISRPVRAEVEFDRDGMRNLVTSSRIPRDIIGELPRDIFRGELSKNDFVTACATALRSERPIPPRFVVLLSVFLSRLSYLREDIIYYDFDHPFNVFLVLSGTFAYANVVTATSPSSLNLDSVGSQSARRTSTGTQDELTTLRPYQFFSRRSYFGDVEVFLKIKGRRSTCVCLSRGDVMVLSKDSLLMLCEEFPELHSVWLVHARRREHTRVWKLAKRGRTDKCLSSAEIAATIIQEKVRERRRLRQVNSKGSHRSTSNDGMIQRVSQTTSVLSRKLSSSLEDADSGKASKQSAIIIDRLSRDVGALRGEVSTVSKEVATLRGDVTGIRQDIQALLRLCGGAAKASQSLQL